MGLGTTGERSREAELLTTEEAARFLRISPQTLSNWRSGASGPPHVKLGKRVAYRMRDLVAWLETREIRGHGGRQGPSRVKIKVRPYHNDPTRHHVDVRIEDPRTTTKSYIRRRLVAPSGMDPLAAKSWGEQQAKDILRGIVRQVRGEKEEATAPAQPSPSVPATATTAPARIMTLAEFWDMFVPGYIARQKRGTQDSYATIWRLHLRPLLGDTPLDLIDRRACARVLEAAQERKLESGTLSQIQAKLYRALRWAMSKGLMPETPLPKIERGPGEKKKVLCLYSPDNLERLLKAARTTADEALVLLAWHGALRIGEIPALQWSDIDWSTGIMMISRNVYKSRVQDNPKGEVGSVPMSPQLIDVLQRMRRDDGSPWVFRPGERTDLLHWTDPSARKRMQALQREAGLPVLGPHRIRHSVLTHLANKGVSPYALQAFARHANMRTTLKYYVHLDRAALAAVAVAALNAAPTKRGNGKPSRGKARGNDLAIAGNSPEFIARMMN